MRGDWVYRDDIRDDTGNLIDAGGTYTPYTSFVLQPGEAQSQGHILYDAANYRQFVRSTNNQFAVFGNWMRAEGARARCLRVKGSFAVTPSVWALGSSYFLGCRILVADQDETGAVLLPTNYNMWAPFVAGDLRPARWANGHENRWEMYHIERFNDNNSTREWKLNVPLRVRLKPSECLCFFTESATGSVNLTVNLRLSTYVVDEA